MTDYPTEPGFIAASVELLKRGPGRRQATSRTRVLFSAHGLPEKVIKAGDPYQAQVEQTRQGDRRRASAVSTGRSAIRAVSAR